MDGVLLTPAKAIVWQVLWPVWDVLLFGGRFCSATLIQWSSHNLLEIDCDCRSVSSLSHISHSQILGSVTPACKSNGCST